MKITVLAENTSCKNNIIAEHGLSLYIQTNNHKILFDSGQSDLFYLNAEKLNIDLSAVDIAFLSHGHYDHSSGMLKFLQINNKAKLYVNENIFGEYYNGTSKYIGVDQELIYSKRLVYVKDFLKIDEELSLYSCNKKERTYSSSSDGLNVKIDDKFMQDNFNHEQYLVIKVNNKNILISGCSHKGVLNIQKWFNPDIFIGGFHISKLNPETEDREELNNIAEILKEYNTNYYTCHCTGVEQFKYLKSILKNKIQYISAGSVTNIF